MYPYIQHVLTFINKKKIGTKNKRTNLFVAFSTGNLTAIASNGSLHSKSY